MTYCLGIKIDESIIMLSDSRTSAGVDNISTYSKMWRYSVPGQRQFVLCSAGNLATTQAVIAVLERDIKTKAPVNLLTVVDMHQASEYIGRVSVACQKQNTGGGPVFETTFLLAGEILGASNGLYMIYSQGNFIASSEQVPYLQIGETKYGKPILDRVAQGKMTTDRAVLCGLVSMDATIRSNLTVGPPIEVTVLTAGSLQPGRYLKLEEDNEYMRNLRITWNKLMEEAVGQLQPLVWPIEG
ncbi:proteasome-type protease [Saccharophagus degradans]|uniref:20S proteasome, A and B subunits n=1 Tax=Saccharophagus degradans (strain 2-40 / ATCC 43961 / DSM 17024) TaxID=203122 RepID=Q21DU7_SACD2|nr:proteasome-type protease [Saccharophagus degradans]ABD83132.1 20S proteasome, A and B subunits [Saccharophagus degradans 2-40]MBU2987035.1 proteasome-type protease [Saccharophagus degradans]